MPKKVVNNPVPLTSSSSNSSSKGSSGSSKGSSSQKYLTGGQVCYNISTDPNVWIPSDPQPIGAPFYWPNGSVTYYIAPDPGEISYSAPTTKAGWSRYDTIKCMNNDIAVNQKAEISRLTALENIITSDCIRIEAARAEAAVRRAQAAKIDTRSQTATEQFYSYRSDNTWNSDLTEHDNIWCGYYLPIQNNQSIPGQIWAGASQCPSASWSCIKQLPGAVFNKDVAKATGKTAITVATSGGWGSLKAGFGLLQIAGGVTVDVVTNEPQPSATTTRLGSPSSILTIESVVKGVLKK